MMRRDGKRKLGWACLVLAVVGLSLAGVACEKRYEPDERSTDDKNRGGARTIPLEAAVTDAVNYTGGDATDWKVVELPDAGTYTVEVFWDHLYAPGGISLHDAYGEDLASATRRTGSTEPIQLVFEARESGLHYIRIYVTQDYSIYSVRVYPGPPRTEGREVVDPRPEFDRPI